MRERDKAILESLQKFRCLSRDDIVHIHFSNLKYPVATANNVLKRLRLQGYITANTLQQPYVYFADPPPIRKDSQKIPHYLAIADFYHQLCQYEKPRIFTVEPKYEKGLMEPDVFMIWKRAPFFVEIQRNIYSSKMMQDKMNRYHAYYESGEWQIEPWQAKEPFFPTIWFITPHRYDVNSDVFRIMQSEDVKALMEKVS
ncbi:Replication-relaxation [Alteribacillus persepolensis]|uniref:Replication-relaxation n=1 Tax=Alteribacillus persepolensis TaxID=568899 RepID=A0A1G8IL86_9BACI|nr:replication-relaxation family protein [Alteribacillus persepolensis]SDI19739.1 Replication-relaxation [Alteribacillus persepolensis]